HLAGIGRDDIEGLNQKQSRSIESGRQLVVALNKYYTSSISNTDFFNADKSYVVWGDNNQSNSFTTKVTNNLPSGVSSINRMERVWKFQNTGTIDSVTIAFYGTFRASADKYLILSSDSSFASGNIWYPLS